MSALPEEVALEILETVPLVMRTMRAEMRRHRQADLSVPQFRTLAFLNRQPGASLNNLAEHLGLTPASTSKLVDGLVERHLVERQLSSEDRRRITLTLTSAGFAVWEESFHNTQAYFAKRLAGLAEADREMLEASMKLLRPLFEARDEGKTVEKINTLD